MSLQDQWNLCRSFERTYVALNESCDHDLEPVIGAFLEKAALLLGEEAVEPVRELWRGGDDYEACVTINHFLGGPGLWLAVVRWKYPKVPDNFGVIGRMANRPEVVPPEGPPPRAVPAQVFLPRDGRRR